MATTADPVMDNWLQNLLFNVGGGSQQAQFGLDSMQLAQAMELARRQFGFGLLGQLMDVQRDPFSIVPALQSYGAAGGGTLAPVNAFAATGGAGAPSPYGSLVDRLLADVSQFSLGQYGQPGGQSATPAASPLAATPLAAPSLAAPSPTASATSPGMELFKRLMEGTRAVRPKTRTNLRAARKATMPRLTGGIL